MRGVLFINLYPFYPIRGMKFTEKYNAGMKAMVEYHACPARIKLNEGDMTGAQTHR